MANAIHATLYENLWATFKVNKWVILETILYDIAGQTQTDFLDYLQ